MSVRAFPSLCPNGAVKPARFSRSFAGIALSQREGLTRSLMLDFVRSSESNEKSNSSSSSTVSAGTETPDVTPDVTPVTGLVTLDVTPLAHEERGG